MHAAKPSPNQKPASILLVLATSSHFRTLLGEAMGEAALLHNLLMAPGAFEHRAQHFPQNAHHAHRFQEAGRMHAGKSEEGMSRAKAEVILLHPTGLETQCEIFRRKKQKVAGVIVVDTPGDERHAIELRSQLRRFFPDVGSLLAKGAFGACRLTSVMFGRGDHLCTRRVLTPSILIGLSLEFLRHAGSEGMGEMWVCPSWFRQRSSDGAGEAKGYLEIAASIFEFYTSLNPRTAPRMRRVASLCALLAEELDCTAEELIQMQPVFLLHECCETLGAERLRVFDAFRKGEEDSGFDRPIRRLLAGVRRSLDGFFLHTNDSATSKTKPLRHWPLAAKIVGAARLVEALLYPNQAEAISLEDLAIALPGFAGTLLDGRVSSAFERLLDQRLGDVVAALELRSGANEYGFIHRSYPRLQRYAA